MSDSHRYQELREALLGGTLTGAESQELVTLFRTRPDLLDELAQSIAIDRLLDLAAEKPEDAAHFPGEVVQRIQTAPQADDFAKSVRHRLKPKPSTYVRWALPIAAVLVLLTIGTWFYNRDTALARVTAQSGLEWRDTRALAMGDELSRGQAIAINTGLIALTLPGRGEVVLEGPAEFRALGPKHFNLDRGRATFTVTKGGRGLTVDTPHGTVVDLGTAFALDVSSASGDLHVIEGRVRFTARGGDRQSLAAGDALRADAGGTTTIAAAGNQFVRQMPGPTASNRDSTSWSWQRSGTPTSDPLVLKSASPDGAPPQRTTEARRDGLRFDGESAYAQTSWPGLAGDTPRTIALWVRVPSSWTAEDGGSLVSWGRFEWREPGVLFDLTLNRHAAKGPVGAPQLNTYGATATAGIDLRDDDWHHLAVTTYQHDDSTSPTQVLFYIDGHLVSSSPRSLPRIDTIAGSGRRGVLVGRSAQSLNSPKPQKDAFFRGMISEVSIFSHAMNAESIRDLMASGAP